MAPDAPLHRSCRGTRPCTRPQHHVLDPAPRANRSPRPIYTFLRRPQVSSVLTITDASFAFSLKEQRHVSRG